MSVPGKFDVVAVDQTTQRVRVVLPCMGPTPLDAVVKLVEQAGLRLHERVYIQVPAGRYADGDAFDTKGA
jgi:hypothetical protein